MLSGSLVAFNAFTLTRLPQIQDLHFEFFPLVLLALDRLLAYGRVRDALALAGWYVLQSLTGTYLMVFTAISIVAATLARPRDWLGARFAVVAPKAALAAAVAVAALTPFLLPYLAASREVGLSRSLEETAGTRPSSPTIWRPPAHSISRRGAAGSGKGTGCSRD